MKTDNKPIVLSIIFTTLFALAMTFLTFSIPWLVPFLCEIMEYENIVTFMTVIAYLAVPAGWWAVILLYKILFNVNNKKVFVNENVKFLNILSWLCFYVGVVSAIATSGYLGFLFVSISAFFIGLIIRIVRNIIQEAIKLKEENELTIWGNTNGNKS